MRVLRVFSTCCREGRAVDVIDPVGALLVAGFFAAGWVVGRFARLGAKPKQPKPICLCEHQYGAHDPRTGKCRTQEKIRFQVKPALPSADVWVTCPCVRYTGPQPVEQYWVPPAADSSIVTAPRTYGEA
jgi:hypothetical protein